jgi:hypothetical protein
VARRVGVDAQRFVRVSRAVVAQRRAQAQGAVVLAVQFRLVGDGHVEVHLLRDVGVRPGGLLQPVNLLERQGPAALGVEQDEPVTAPLVVGARRGRLVARPVPEAEELAVELGEPARVGGVQHHLRQPGEVAHRGTSARYVVPSIFPAR